MRLNALGCALAGALAVGTAAPALAAPPITAQVPAGHRLVALAADGKLAAAKATRGRVRLTPTAKRVTLHLIGPGGSYAGPVTVGAIGRRAVVGVRAGAVIGRIRVLKGAFRAAPAPRAVDLSRTSIRAKGVPIGARSLGLVRSPATGPAGPGRDRDRDGVPSAYDIDDDGDLVLDNLEASVTGRVAQAPPLGPPPGASSDPRAFSNLKLPIDGSLNVNAGGGISAIDAAVRSAATLAITVPAGDAVELDCGALSYCSAGGTGRVLGGGAFPGALDADGDGFGTITPGMTGDFQLAPGATSSQIGSGDAFVWRITRGGRETLVPGVLNYQFVTTPAITAYAIDGGAPTGVAYPVGPGGAGTQGNPIAVPAGGPASLSLTLWRPQRAAIAGAGERGDWVDIGGLTYSIDLPNAPSVGGPGAPGGRGAGLCATSLLTSGSATLTSGDNGLRDTAADAAPNVASTLSLTVDLAGCVAGRPGESWDPGETLKVDLQARTAAGDNAAQAIWLRRAP